MNILLTGHKGFIGTQIFESFKSDGYNIDGVDIGDSVPPNKI